MPTYIQIAYLNLAVLAWSWLYLFYETFFNWSILKLPENDPQRIFHFFPTIPYLCLMNNRITNYTLQFLNGSQRYDIGTVKVFSLMQWIPFFMVFTIGYRPDLISEHYPPEILTAIAQPMALQILFVRAFAGTFYFFGKNDPWWHPCHFSETTIIGARVLNMALPAIRLGILYLHRHYYELEEVVIE